MWRAVVTQPLDRTCELPVMGELDEATGEFWLDRVFQMPRERKNLSSYERNRLFLNLDGNSFLDASFASACDIDSDSRSVIAGDFDRDGAPDLLVGSVGGGPVRLFLNEFPKKNRRTRIRLQGVDSNRTGIGTRVIARCGERNIVRDVFAANGCLGQSPAELILGVGDADHIDELTVRWPTGKSQRFSSLKAGSSFLITENDDKPQIEPDWPNAPTNLH